MKPYLKYTILCAFLIVAVQYWVLAIISEWLVDDSYALDVFPKTHPFLGAVVQFIWVGDWVFGRYILIVVLGAVFWWIVRRSNKQKIHEPHA